MSMRHIQKLDLARSYVSDELSQGMTLAKLALRNIDLMQGRFFAWLPVDRRESDIKHFGYDLLMKRAEELQQQLGFARFVRAFVQPPGHALILQDTVNDNAKGDPFEALAATYYQEQNYKELYWHIANSRLSDEDIVSIIGAPILPYPWCGFFYDNVSIAGKTRLTLADFDEIVGAIVGVAVGAFHQESYLLWWNDRQTLPSTPEATE